MRGEFQGRDTADISQSWVWSEATPGRFGHPDLTAALSWVCAPLTPKYQLELTGCKKRQTQ